MFMYIAKYEWMKVYSKYYKDFIFRFDTKENWDVLII